MLLWKKSLEVQQETIALLEMKSWASCRCAQTFSRIWSSGILLVTVTGNHSEERTEKTFLSCHLQPSLPLLLWLSLLFLNAKVQHHRWNGARQIWVSLWKIFSLTSTRVVLLTTPLRFRRHGSLRVKKYTSVLCWHCTVTVALRTSNIILHRLHGNG